MDAQELFDGSIENPFTPYEDLKGRRVFITGGGSGLGAYFVTAFALQGAKVGFLSLNPEPAQYLCEQIEKKTGRAPFYQSCDIRNITEMQAVMDAYMESVDGIDILVNNAARDDRMSLCDISSDQWDESVNTNLRPYIFSTQKVIPSMGSNGGGVIVNISSNAPSLGIPGFPAYIAAKSAITGMTKSLAQEVGSKGIRVNTILPGWCLTERQKRLWATDEAVEKTLERQALKRLLSGVDLTNAVLFFSSSASSMITGVSMNVNGGIC